MSSEQALMQKLMISKKIMDKHNTIERNQNTGSFTSPEVQNFNPIDAKYNIPDGIMEQQETPKNYNTETPTKDKIVNSNLPDEIKKLMIEHPIDKPSMGVHTNVGLSNDLVERASRLMNSEKTQNTNNKQSITESKSPQLSVDSEIKTMIRDVVRDTVRDVLREELKEAGMLVESTSDSNDTIQFKVGKHLFVGKVLKVKKMSS